MAELLDESSSLESTTVGVYRTSATVKGGRRFSFSALVVVGDRSGRVGLGYAKSNQVPQAIEKAQKVAKRKMQQFPMIGRTLPHAVTGRFGACKVKMVPASPGTGVIAGAAARAVLEMLGVQDCLTKAFGSTNPKNLVKAALDGLSQLRTKQLVSELRGVELGMTTVEEAIERSKAFMTASPSGEKARAPVNTVGMDSKSGGRGGRGGDRRGGAGGGGRGRRQTSPEATADAGDGGAARPA
jgi:small subunit ribosomal protein S5